MKLSNLLIILSAIAIPITIFAVTKAMSAPLPVGFPSPTAHGKIEVKQYPAYRSGTYTYEAISAKLLATPLIHYFSTSATTIFR